MSNKRTARKLATRERILQAARELFEDIGFEAATIRMIAERAGVAVGSVFTTFSSKVDVLNCIMQERLDGLYAELDKVAPHLPGSCLDRLRSVMAVLYGFEAKRSKLFAAYMAVETDLRANQGVPALERYARLAQMLRDILKDGVRDGEVRSDADADLFVDTLSALYGVSYSRAAREGMDPEALAAMMDRRIGLIFNGVARR